MNFVHFYVDKNNITKQKKKLPPKNVKFIHASLLLFNKK